MNRTARGLLLIKIKNQGENRVMKGVKSTPLHLVKVQDSDKTRLRYLCRIIL